MEYIRWTMLGCTDRPAGPGSHRTQVAPTGSWTSKRLPQEAAGMGGYGGRRRTTTQSPLRYPLDNYALTATATPTDSYDRGTRDRAERGTRSLGLRLGARAPGLQHTGPTSITGRGPGRSAGRGLWTIG